MLSSLRREVFAGMKTKINVIEINPWKLDCAQLLSIFSSFLKTLKRFQNTLLIINFLGKSIYRGEVVGFNWLESKLNFWISIPFASFSEEFWFLLFLKFSFFQLRKSFFFCQHWRIFLIIITNDLLFWNILLLLKLSDDYLLTRVETLTKTAKLGKQKKFSKCRTQSKNKN